MRKRNLRFRNLFMIIFISYMIVLIIPLILTGTIYFQSESVLKDKIIDSNFAVLRQMQNTVDDRLNEIDQLTNQILVNQQTVKLMYTSGVLNGSKRMTLVNLLKDFSSYKNITPFIDSFFIYFTNMDYIVTSSSSCSPEFYFNSFVEGDIDYAQWRKTYLESTHNGHFVETLTKSVSSQPRQTMAFWKSLSVTSKTGPVGNICILVDLTNFESLLSSAEELDGGMAYVLNSNNEIFFSSPNALDSLPSDFAFHREGKGELTGKIGQVDYVYTYMNSKETGLTYITAFPKSILQEDLDAMRRFSQIAIYICVILALAIIFFLTYRNYKPIQNIARQFDEDAEESEELNAFRYIERSVERITNKNQQFSAEMRRYKPLFRSTFLLKLINGFIKDGQELKEALQSYSLSFKDEDFVVILMRVEDASHFVSDNSEEERNYVRLILSNISEELAGSIGFGCCVETEADTMCLILNLPSMNPKEAREKILALVERTKYEIEAYFKIIMSISIGKVGKGIDAIHTSYLDALHALDYRMIKGVSAIIFADEINHTTSYYHYPTDTENHLINFVRSGDYTKAERILKDLFSENFQRRKLPLSVGKCLVFDIISTAIKLLDLLNMDYDLIFGKSNPVEKLLQYETIYQAQDMLLDMFRQICEYINNNKRSHNDELKSAVLGFIDKAYGDEKLSQTMIADHFGISPNYLSNFFHEQVGEKMSAYISSIRVNKAKELLRQTDSSISQIAEAVGFGSDLSLIRVFKKIEGLTPGQYRQQSKGKG